MARGVERGIGSGRKDAVRAVATDLGCGRLDEQAGGQAGRETRRKREWTMRFNVQ